MKCPRCKGYGHINIADYENSKRITILLGKFKGKGKYGYPSVKHCPECVGSGNIIGPEEIKVEV